MIHENPLQPTHLASPPTDAAAAAAQVAAHLVMVRGGAPFLSGADARLLTEWIDEELPVAGILACIDAVVERRRKRPATSRLTLSACKAEVKKLRQRLGAASTGARPPAPPPGGGWAALAAAVAESPAPDGPKNALVATILDHERSGTAPDAALALAAVRAFELAVWEASDQDALRAAATAELGAVLAVVRPRQRAELVEQGARDLLRRRWPALSAAKICDLLGALP